MTVPVFPVMVALRPRTAVGLRMVEPALALAACVAAAIAASWHLLRPGVYSDDAFVHQYWMWTFRDGDLFGDPLTAELRESARYPLGYVLLFRLAVPFASPITIGEWLGVALMALSGFLVFLIVREHTAWKPAAWIAAALFLSLIDIHRFHGGFPRAFVHPVVLGCVLLAIRRRDLAAAGLAGGSALLYPPAAVLAVGVLLVTAVRWSRRPSLDRRRAGAAGLAFAALCAIVLGPALLGSGSPEVLSAAQARAYPEFGPRGPLHFFTPSTLEYLRQNRSGFDLRVSGSILALAALGLLVLARGRARLRPEVLALPVVALGCWAVAQAVLFQLYLPHRFTYPLLAFFAIAAGVSLRPAWEAVVRVRPAAGAGAAGAALVALVLAVPAHGVRGSRCPGGPAVQYLATLPKDAIVAGDPIDMKCLPATARRAVVTSTQLAPAYEKAYFLDNRKRMFALLDAVYGADPAAIATAARVVRRHPPLDPPQRRRIRAARRRRPLAPPSAPLRPPRAAPDRVRPPGLAVAPLGMRGMAARPERRLRHRLSRSNAAGSAEREAQERGAQHRERFEPQRRVGQQVLRRRGEQRIVLPADKRAASRAGEEARLGLPFAAARVPHEPAGLVLHRRDRPGGGARGVAQRAQDVGKLWDRMARPRPRHRLGRLGRAIDRACERGKARAVGTGTPARAHRVEQLAGRACAGRAALADGRECLVARVREHGVELVRAAGERGSARLHRVRHVGGQPGQTDGIAHEPSLRPPGSPLPRS